MPIYLQYYTSNKFEPEEQSLYNAFSKRGCDIQPFCQKHMLRNRIHLSSDDLVAGNITVMHHVFKSLGAQIPTPNDYPPCLKKYLKRNISTSTLNDIRNSISGGQMPNIFIKPKDRLKRFTGFPLTDEYSLHRIANISKSTEVWVSDIVCWISEFRVFVLEGKILDVKYYSGNPDVMPDMATIYMAINDYNSLDKSPIAYAIDFGVLDSGDTALIEVNDGYSIGSYGLDDDMYADLIQARYYEIITRKQ